jgi:hypothetical protein
VRDSDLPLEKQTKCAHGTVTAKMTATTPNRPTAPAPRPIVAGNL